MAIYNYTALKDKVEMVKGKIEAEDLREARDNVRQLGFLPVKVEPEVKIDEATNANAVDKIGQVNKIPNMKLQDKIDFTSTLQILAQSGIPIIESLLFIEKDAAKLRLRLVAAELRRQIMNGGTFADTVAKYQEQFGQIYIGLCKAGEDSGELEKTLERLLELLNKQAAIKSKVIGTLMYPIFVIVLAVLIVLVMLIFVFPVFKDMFEQQGKDLPFITAFLMDIGLFLRHQWYLVPLILGSVVGGIMFAFKWPRTRHKIDEYVLKIPVFGEFMKFSDFSNFIAVLQVAYDAGVPIVECLHLANLTLVNYILHTKVITATTAVQQGQHLSTALKMTKVMPSMLLFMIATGEQSGRLGDMLLQATRYIDKQLDTFIDTLTKMIEPIMLIVIGSIVLVLALALYLPLFGSYMS